jgi:alanine dehydrogenase
MPIKLKKIFEKEYGKKKGDKIFYAYENKLKSKKLKNNFKKSKSIKYKKGGK